MEIKLNLDPKLKYLAGISGGPDSMALLSSCVKQGYQVVVAFVNYQLRESAKKDEHIVRAFCKEHDLPIFALYPIQHNKENFQKWAREVRYDFYKEIAEKEKCDALLLGHQLDDSLENYLMALQRKSHGWVYGIAKESEYKGLKIIRPLLSYRKQWLREYDLLNHVDFGDDESNFTDKYTRNKIRHQLVENADDGQVQKWLNEMNQLNSQMAEKRKSAQQLIKNNECSINDYRRTNAEIRRVLLRELLYRDDPQRSYNESFIENMDRTLMNCNHHFTLDLYRNRILVYEYERFYICEKTKNYQYILTKVKSLEKECFKISDHGETIESITLSEDDFPLTIRNGKADDNISLRYGHKKLGRMFIDKKIPYWQRIRLPVVVNKAGTVIFASKIGCDIDHYSTQPTLFVVEL